MAGNTTDKLWSLQNRHPGDREALFAGAAEQLSGTRVLYPGSFVDIAASFVFPDVTYIDVDARAERFFADRADVERIVSAYKRFDGPSRFSFIHADYNSDLDLAEQEFDLLISLYAGFVSRACGRYLRIGGLLPANNSHGDAGMASIDPEFELAAVIDRRDGTYRSSSRNLDKYLIPRNGRPVTRQLPEKSGRGVGYTRSPSAYLFRRVGA